MIQDGIEHIKEKNMDGKYITARASLSCGTYDVSISLAEAERLGAEAQRIKAENEIKVGDWIFYESQKLFLKVARVSECGYVGTNDFTATKSGAVKITNPSHIQALTEIYEAHK